MFLSLIQPEKTLDPNLFHLTILPARNAKKGATWIIK